MSLLNGANEQLSPRNHFSQSISSKSQSQSQPTNIVKSANRLKEIRARCICENANVNSMGQPANISTPKSRQSVDREDDINIDEMSDDEVICDDSDRSGRSRDQLGSEIRKTVEDVIDISDGEEVPVSAPLSATPHSPRVNDVRDIVTIEISETEPEERVELISSVPTTPQTKSNDGIIEDHKSESNDDCILIYDDEGKTSEDPVMSVSLLEEEEFKGFGTPRQPSRLHLISQENGEVSEGTGHADGPGSGAAVTAEISADVPTAKTLEAQLKLTKPCYIPLFQAKIELEKFFEERNEKEEERKLRSREKSKEIQEGEPIPMETADSVEGSSSQGTSNFGGITRAHETEHDSERKGNEVYEKLEKQGSGERKRRGRKPGSKNKIKVRKISSDDREKDVEDEGPEITRRRCTQKSRDVEGCESDEVEVEEATGEKSNEIASSVEKIVDYQTPKEAEKLDNVSQVLETQTSGERKKRGRKPGVKAKPKSTLEVPAVKPKEPYQYSKTVGNMTINVITKNQAMEKAPPPNNDGFAGKAKRGRKLGVKNKPKGPGGGIQGFKRPKRKYTVKAKSQCIGQGIIQEPELHCCYEKPCCVSVGCSHGNNHKRIGKLLSLPDNTEFLFAEQKYQETVEKINERMAQANNSDSGTDSVDTEDQTGDGLQKAIIEFAPIELISNSESNGKKIRGFTVPLPLSVPMDDFETLEKSQEDKIPKPKIVQDETFPEGTLNHVLPKLLKTGAPQSTTAPTSPRREKFGIRSTVPSRKCLNPSKSSAIIDSKILSCFDKTWRKIPEIAALMSEDVSSPKKIRSDESFDGDTTDERQSSRSPSISNIDVMNGHARTSLLNGLFSKPHILSSSTNNRRTFEKISHKSVSKDQRIIKGITSEKKYGNKTNRPRLTKENLEIINQSTDAQDGLDVMSHIMKQMQVPGKTVPAIKIPLSPPIVARRLPEDGKYQNGAVGVKNNRKRIADENLQSPDEKRVKRNSQWSLNGDDDLSETSNDSRLSVFVGDRSRSSYILSGFEKKSATGKNELIDAWLTKDVDSKDATSHSPHSAKTFMNTPNERNDGDLEMADTLEAILQVGLNSEDTIDEATKDVPNKDDIPPVDSEHELSSGSSSSKTVTESLKESSSSGIGTQDKEKQSSFETDNGGNIQASQPSAVVVPQDDDEEEDDDALFLDVGDDDLMEETPETHEAKKDKDKPPQKISPIKRQATPPRINPNESPKRIAPIVSSSILTIRGKSAHIASKPVNWDDGEILDRASNSETYQMANFDRYASQTYREFNDQYSAVDAAEGHEPGDDYDVYAPVQNTERMYFPKDPKVFFKGLCYAYLKTGKCSRLDCPFHNNKFSFYLQNLSKAFPAVIESVLNHAIQESYFHALLEIYPDAVKQLSLRSIQNVCTKIHVQAVKHKTKVHVNYAAYKFYQESMKPIVAALIELKKSPITIINMLSKCFLLPDDDDIKKLMRVLIASKQIAPGFHWDTFRDLVKQLTSAPPQFLVSLILHDCVKYDKSREYLEEVYENVIRRIPQPTLQTIDSNLLKPFTQFSDTIVGGHVNDGGDRTPMPDNENDFSVGGEPCPQIASPDDVRHVERCEEKTKTIVLEPRRKSVKERLGRRVALNGPRRVEEQEPLDLIPIDRVSRPTSLYKKHVQDLHLDLGNIRHGLKHRDYRRVIDTLNCTRNRETKPFAKGFYHILCREVMTSADHLQELIKLSVHTRSFRILHLLFEIGSHFLIKLANDGTWIIAYRLLKILKRMCGIREAPKYIFLMAEIFIANQRPLKALALLNQYNLISLPRNNWALRSHSIDKSLRKMILGNLLMSLCGVCPQEALSVFKKMLEQQINCYEPIDLSQYTDEICKSLLKSNRKEELVEIANLIVRHRLNARRSTLRALIVAVFHSDFISSRRLHQYTTWIGLYPIINIINPTCIRINTDYTEEEMFLQIFHLFKNIRDKFGALVKDIIPENVLIYLNFQIVPQFKCIINARYNAIALARAKKLMKKALKHFNPAINVVKDMENIFKLSGENIVAYLNSENFQRLLSEET
ncbi:uncharacterized protein [Fopius arisanus]|uniref:Uncharacterized protein isoform X2 n=1 Tax=Fopius arisanus TaxID=64838 RepID=A0A9R1SXK6_9HYME|nr:PREDICTED: uncharacterized protein LOC105264087 isoform X2 [Fopius arisanus]